MLDEFSVKPSLNQLVKRKEFGFRIRERRYEKNLSIAELSERAMISQELVLRIESGLVDPEITSIVKRLEHALESEKLIIV
jgi:predicted transcriptional regulator